MPLILGTAREPRRQFGMRVGVAALVAVGGACASSGPATDLAPPAPPVPRLATPGHLFLINTERGTASCERWDVVPAAAGEGRLVRAINIDGQVGIEVLAYRLVDATLTLTGRSRESRLHGGTMMGCEVKFPSADLADAVAVGDSRWFAHAAGCTEALAQHARVATDLTECDVGPLVPKAVQQATRHAFEALLRGGGVAYAEVNERCEAFNVTPSPAPRAGFLTGSMWRESVRGNHRSTSGTRYLFMRGGAHAGGRGPDELTRLGAGVTNQDGSGYGLGCARTDFVSYGRGVVNIDGGLYLTDAGCRDALAARRLHDAWVPEVADADPDEEADVDDDASFDGADPAEAGDAIDGDEGDAVTTSFGLSGC